MAKQHAKALSNMGFKDVTIVSRTQENVEKLCKEFGFHPLSGGYEKHLGNLKEMDLVIITTPPSDLLSAAESAINANQTNILIEKPGSLYVQELLAFNKKIQNQRIRIGWHRLLSPSFQKLKSLIEEDGGLSSCRFTFTEWIETIPFEKYGPEVCNRWGIANSLHIISMAFDLIGMPKEITPFQGGELEWHKAGSIFVGSGISEKNIPFSYDADWKSGGRWGIEVMTEKNVYKMIPVEELHKCKKGSVDWESVPLETTFPNVKQGVAEEIAVMVADEKEEHIKLVTLPRAAEFNKITEKIFGYSQQN